MIRSTVLIVLAIFSISVSAFTNRVLLTKSSGPLSGFVFVPTDGVTPGFYVTKYEVMAEASSPLTNQKIVSRPGSGLATIAGLTFDGISSVCKGFGPKVDVISNSQWQVIARNIAKNGKNWSSGSKNVGAINIGLIIKTTSGAGLSDETDNCLGTGEVCSRNVWSAQRRTHELSNGSIIWDFAGNFPEYVSGAPTRFNAYASGSTIETLDADPTASNLYGNDPNCDQANCGYGSYYVPNGITAIIRGGDPGFSGSTQGLFSVQGIIYSNNPTTGASFRCVYTP